MFNGNLKLSKRETPPLSLCNVFFLSKKSFSRNLRSVGKEDGTWGLPCIERKLTANRFKALEKKVANLRSLKSGKGARGGCGAHRGRGARGGAHGAARGGRGGLRSGAGSDEQEPRLCVVCGVAEHLADSFEE
jgi:hypothetical protein